MTTGRDRPDHPLERLIFFSDAVFAIAITLLIIDVHAPHLPRGSNDAAYLQALADLLPSLLGFFVSFFVIGAFWAGHHRAFALAGHHSEKLTGPNLMMLCTVVFMPFSTAFMSSNYGATIPTVVYCLTLLVTGLCNVRLVRLVTSPPIVAEHVPAETIALTRMRGFAVILGALTALLVAFISPYLSQPALMSIPLWRLLLQRQARRSLAA